MKDFEDYSGPYINFLDHGHFSKDFLLKLLPEWENAIKLVVHDYNEEFPRLLGEEKAKAAIDNIWEGYAEAMVPVIAQLLSFDKDVTDMDAKAWQLLPKVNKDI